MGYFRNKNEFLAYICNTALPEFRKGNFDYGKVLHEVFLYPEESGVQAMVANAYRGWMDSISVKKLIRLSKEFRKNFFDGWYFTEFDKRWERAVVDRNHFSGLSDAQYGAMLKFGTWMGNGYYRERCIEALDGQDNALFFLILRMNDWVAKIREIAFRCACKRMKECGIQEFFLALPALEEIRNLGRRRDISQLECLEELSGKVFAEKFAVISEQELCEISTCEVNIKNAIYRFVSKNKVLKQEYMEFLFSREKTGYGKVTLLSGIFDYYGYTEEKIEWYLLCKNTAVRYYALQYRYKKEHRAWAGILAMLLDKSKRIREYAGYILKRHTEIDLLNFYKEQLKKGVLEIALIGIAEQGSKTDLKDIVPFLESKNAKLCKTALLSYAKLAMESGETIYWKFLFDSRLEISRSAYQCIRKYHIHYGAFYLYKTLLEYCGTVYREYLLNLLLCEPSWERLPYLLLLYGRKEFSETEQVSILSGINNRYVYGRISARQKEKIEEILERQSSLLPDKTAAGIRFDLEHVVQKTEKFMS